MKPGDGGAGCVSFMRTKTNPKGGPDGGDGGKGGSIIFKASGNKSTLLDFEFTKEYIAENGAPGSTNNKTGRDGKDIIIEVPVGTIIKDFKSKKILVDLDEKDKTIVLFEGGRGGKGNTFFKTSSRQSPKNAQPGEKKENISLIIELKLLADVGLVGLPNAGKSTLISKISSAKPKIADYPFTTLVPNLGVVKVEDKNFLVADIPGLIEGAHRGQGLGIQFLKHIERTKILLHLIDVSNFNASIENINIINNELKLFSKELTKKPMIYVLTKLDAASEEKIIEFETYMKKNKYDYFKISAVTGDGIKTLIGGLVKILYG